MRPGWHAALTAVTLLLAAVDASAQFFDKLAKLNPEHIVSSIAKKSPQEIASQANLNPQHIVDSIAKKSPQEIASQVVNSEPTHKIADTLQEVGKKLRNATASQAEVPATMMEVATTTTQPADSKPQKSSVADALQTMGDAIQHVGEVLNTTKTGGITDNPSKVVDILKDSAPKSLSKESLDKAHDGLEAATKAIASSPQGKELKEAGHGLVDALHIPAPDKVHDAVQKTSPQAADWLKQAVDHVRHANPEKVKQEISQRAPKVAEAIKHGRSGPTDPTDVESPDGGDDSRSHWVLLTLGVCLAGAAAAGGWYLFTSSKRDVRSPTLLTAEMGVWGGPSNSGGAPQHDEPLFRQ